MHTISLVFYDKGGGASVCSYVLKIEAIELTILARGIKRGGALRSYKSLNFNFKLNSRMESWVSALVLRFQVFEILRTVQDFRINSESFISAVVLFFVTIP